MADDLALFKEEVKNRVDIADVIGEYVDLRRKGSSIMGLCPFHAEKSPSFNVNRDGQFYHCFGCGKGGDVFSFLMDITGMSFMEALEHLSERTGLEMPKKRGFDRNAKDIADRVAVANLAAAEYFHKMLSAPEGERGMAYLRDRGLEPATIRAFRLGFAPEDPSGLVAFAKTKGVDIDALDTAGILLKSKYGGPPYGRFGGRIIFPIIDQAARVLGFGGRILEGEGAKYVNSPETSIYHKSRVLFGLYQSRVALRKERAAIVVEGYMDLISLHQAGIQNVLAASGTAFTSDQGRIISRLARSVILLFDGDSAGIHAAARSADTFLSTNLAVSVSLLPGGHDPDSYVRAEGADALREHLGRAMDIWEFKLLALANKTVAPEDRLRLAGEIADSISLIPDELKREVYIKELSMRIGVDLDAMRKAVDGRIRKRSGRAVDESGNGKKAAAEGIELLAAMMRFPSMARRFMEETGTKVFSDPGMRAAADVIFHRVVEGLDVTAATLMTALDDPAAKETVAAAAVITLDESTAAGYIERNLRLFAERELKAEIERTSRLMLDEADPSKKHALQERQTALKTRLSHLMKNPPVKPRSSA